MKKILTSWWFSLVIGLAVFVGVVIAIRPPAPAEPAGPAEPGGEGGEAPDAAHPKDAVEQLLTETNAPLYTSNITPVTELEAGAPGSLRWDDPEVKQAMKEYETKRAALEAKEKSLNAMQARLLLEYQQISTITQAVAQAKSDWLKSQSSKVISVEKEEDKKYRDIASMFTNMAPASAVTILEKQPVEEVVQIIQRMSVDQRAVLLEQFTKATNAARAVEISQALLRLGAKPGNP